MTEPINLLEPLNEREQEIIECLVDGLSNREIADKLFLAPSTVKWYIRQLNQKLDTKNRREIVERVQELGLLETEAPKESYFRPRENLPRQTTPFVGRDSELDDLHAIIEKEDIRLLTILAPGGMGKTRIALEATEQQSNRFPDGVYFVPLQALSEPEQIIPQIAVSTFFAFQNDNRSQKQQVLDFLSNKQMLLCIDNWEHLLDGALLLNEILEVAPQVKIIATSREKLNLLAETVYVLQGMQFPEWETPDDALRYDAVQLLVQSAQRVKPDWIITEGNLNFVARVCRLTQGMPLGILLASSWLDVYSLERICAEIQKSADILETDMRDVPERQRSIRAIFDYSWQKLSTKEQDAFVKMSVFRGGFTREAAEEITDANLRILQSLMNKALLQINKSGRYDLHELLRQYAEERLDDLSVEIDTRDKHSHHYAQKLQELLPALKDHRQLPTVNEIELDFGNILKAWYQAYISENQLLLLDMGEPLLHFAFIGNRQPEVFELYDLLRIQLIAIKAPETNQELLIMGLAKWYYSPINATSSDDIIHLLETGLKLARKHRDTESMILCLNRLGRQLIYTGQLKAGKTLIDDACELIPRVNDPTIQCWVLLDKSMVFSLEGNVEEAYRVNTEALHIAEASNNIHLANRIMNNRAILLTEMGKLEEAATLQKKVLSRILKIGHVEGISNSLFGLTISLIYLMQLDEGCA